MGILVTMSEKRLALDMGRVKKALDLDIPLSERSYRVEKLNIERDTLIENTDKMSVEENSLISSNRQYVASVLDDFKKDLAELENSISDYRRYLKELKEKEKYGP